MYRKSIVALTTAPLLAAALSAHGVEAGERLTVAGVLAGVAQCQDVSAGAESADDCAGAVVFQPEIDYRPADGHELFAKFGFAAGNGVNGHSPFVYTPWAADLEDDLEDINGRGRDHLLTAWYRYSTGGDGQRGLAFTLGVIDATDYLDENAYANDEFTQFMHPALTNGPNVFLPSYDFGAAVQWDAGAWSLRAVWMNIGENDDGNEFDFHGVQAGYHADTALGPGNYRMVLAAGSGDFLDPTGTRLEERAAALLSFDQALGESIGVWLRAGWQTNDAAVDHDAIYSGGVDFGGAAWGREGDNVGVGYAYLDGGSLDVAHSHVAEVYYRWQLRAGLGLTADLQYQEDELDAAAGPGGWTFGLRAAAEF